MTPEAISNLLENRMFALGVRLALTSPFWLSGGLKLLDWDAALAEMNHFGLAPAAPLAILVILLQLGCVLAIIVGRMVWLATGVLGVFTAIATLLAHAYWSYPEPERFAQFNIFFEHLSIIGGLAIAAMLAEQEKTS